MVLNVLAILIPPPLIAALAIAADRPDNFVSAHPDVAQWVMGTLFIALCGMVAIQWRGVLKEQKQQRKDFTEAQKTVVTSMQDIAREVQMVCIDVAKVKQHCADVCAFKEDGG